MLITKKAFPFPMFEFLLLKPNENKWLKKKYAQINAVYHILRDIMLAFVSGFESNLMRLFRVTRQFIGLSFICLSNAMCNWFATRKNEINCTYVRISLVNKVPIHSVKWMEIEHSNDAMMAEYTAIEVQALHYGWRETDTANAHHKWKTAYRNTNSNWSWQFSIRNLESGLSRAALPVGLWKTYKHAHKSK